MKLHINFPALFLAAFALLQFAVPAKCAEPEYVLSLNLPIPPIHNRWTHAIKPWVEEIEKRTNGRVKIEPYFAESLGKEADAFDSVKTGVADLAEFSFDVAVGQFPFHERAMTLASPGVSIERPQEWLMAMQESFPQVMKEFAGVKLLFTHAQTVGMLIGSKDPITTLDGFKGKKINVIGDYQVAKKVDALGASVVSMPLGEVFTSLQQGVVDAITVDYDLLVSRRFGEVIKHVTAVQTTCFVFGMLMNEDVYNSLPDDIKKVFAEASVQYAGEVFANFWTTLPYKSLDTWFRDMGGKLHVLQDDEYAEIDRRIAPVRSEWINIINRAGYPGEEMAKRMDELQARFARPWKESRSEEIARKGSVN